MEGVGPLVKLEMQKGKGPGGEGVRPRFEEGIGFV